MTPEPIALKATEEKFSSERGRAEFVSFCNSVIVLESPRISTFPNLSTKAGADGGIDGQWDLSDASSSIDGPFTRRGWNVYQFKSVDVHIGYEKAFGQLCQRANGAVADLISRLALPACPALYVFFTNLQLGIARPTRTKRNARQNERFATLRSALLRGAPAGIEVEIFDGGKLDGILAKHRVLRVTWFAEHASSTWAEAYAREVNQWQLDAPLKGREAELKQLDAWLTDDAVRVIALSGVNSIGKTRLALECTRQLAPVTFFADDTSRLLREGVGMWASSSTGPIVIVVEDPSSADAERLARQTLGSDRVMKLVMTIPSQKEIPATVFGDELRVKARHIGPLLEATAQQLLEELNPNLDYRARDWVLQQAGGNPGIIIEAAMLGPELRRSVEGLRDRLTKTLRKRLDDKFGAESVLTAILLSPLSYVRISEDAELRVLLQSIAPTLSEPIVRLRVAELETFGCIRRRGKTVAVVPPMFATGLLQELVAASPNLPLQLFSELNHDARTRLLDRLVAVELSDTAPFWDQLLNVVTNQVTSELKERLEMLESLARAVPRVIASFLNRELNELLRNVKLSGDPTNLDRVGAVIQELIEEPETGEEGFDLLTRLAEYNASHDNRNLPNTQFLECFVWWYPRPFSYRKRQATVETLLKSDQVSIRLLAVNTLVTATEIPHSLSGRGVVPRRLGPEPNRTLKREVYEFLQWATKRRLDIAQSRDMEMQKAAAHELENAIGPLAQSLPGETAMELIDVFLEHHFAAIIAFDIQNLLGQLKWTRNLYAKYRDEGAEELRESWNGLVTRLDKWIEKITSGPFQDRLRLALGPTFDHEEVEFEGRKLYAPHVRVIKLAREALANPAKMDDAWELLVADRTPNVQEFVHELGRRDATHRFHSELVSRADTWQWASLLGVYLAGAKETDREWVKSELSKMPVVRGESNLASLLAFQQTGLDAQNRLRLQTLMTSRAVKPEHVALAFSYGRWLEMVPPHEVRNVLEYIETDPRMTARLAEVISLYIHALKLLPRELFAVARRTLVAALHVSDGHGSLSFHCDQIALGMAKTDINDGFALLQEVLQVNRKQNRLSLYGGWSVFDTSPSREFIAYLRGNDPERLYTALGKLNRPRYWADLQRRPNNHLLDLVGHADLLLRLARGDLAMAEVFADCLVSSQPGFLEFVSKLLEAYPYEQGIRLSLTSAVVEKTGFGSGYEYLTEAEQFVQHALKHPQPPDVVRQWLQSVGKTIDDRRAEQQRLFGEDIMPE